MKKGYWTGFVSALGLTVLVLGLGTAAQADHSISVNDAIRVTVNGAEFQPKDGKGNAVPLFTYNGTTYAPVRAICEAAGLMVDYDAQNSIAVLSTPEQLAASRPDSAKYIGVDRAKELAMQDAGVTAADAVFLKARLDIDDGKAEYDVEFYVGATEYDYDLNALTGAVVSKDLDADDFDLRRMWDDDPEDGDRRAGQPTADSVITSEKAQELALSKAPAGTTVKKCELDRDDGRLVYEVELQNGATEYECDVNALTGVILHWSVDD